MNPNKTNLLADVDRSQLVGVTGGGQIVHGIQNAKTGEWKWREEIHYPDPKPDLMVPTHIEAGIIDAKTGLWIKKETLDYLRPVPQK
jgi:hypothetical protein